MREIFIDRFVSIAYENKMSCSRPNLHGNLVYLLSKKLKISFVCLDFFAKKELKS
jgi:hypothetical protein